MNVINTFTKFIISSKAHVHKSDVTKKQKPKEQKIDFTQLLPQEISREIFSYLNAPELGRCLLVSKDWKKIASHHDLWNALPPKMAFDKEQWEKYFGDISEVPLLPKDIHKILKSPCPFWPDKTVEETHVLVLIPRTVNGVPLNLTTLGELVKAPRKGPGTQYRFIFNKINELGFQSTTSHWALITRDNVPGSRNKSYSDQQAFIAEKTRGEYEVCNVLDAACCIFMHYMSSKERLFYSDRYVWNYSRCQEKIDDVGLHIGVGGFSYTGLVISTCFNDNVGAMALRKFF